MPLRISPSPGALRAAARSPVGLIRAAGRLVLRMALVVLGGAAVMAAAAAVLALAGAFTPGRAFAAEPHQGGDRATVVEAANALRDIPTMRADFEQTDANGQRVKGVLTLKRGGLLRFQYAPGYPMLIVADGHALSVYDTELKKLQRWPVGDSPLGALLDPGKDVTRFGSVVPAFDPRLVSIAVHDRAHPEYGTLTLTFTRAAAAPGGLELAGWVAEDAQSRRTSVRLSGQRYGVPAPADLFRITNPMAGPHH